MKLKFVIEQLVKTAVQVHFKAKKLRNSRSHTDNNNKSYANISSDTNQSLKETQKYNKFEMSLHGKCSWSYKSLKADGKIKNDKTNTNSSTIKSFQTSSSENGSEVYNFEVLLGKKDSHNKVCKQNYFDLKDVDKADLCYDFNEVDQSKKTKRNRKKPTKNYKKTIPPRTTTITLRNKKRISYADSNDETDLNLDKNEDCTTQTDLKSIYANQSIISRDSEYSDDEGLVFQTRYSDKNANILQITNTIESDSNDIFENLESLKTTTSPTILKLGENLRSNATEQTSSDNQSITFGDSPLNYKVLEKSKSQTNSQSESEVSYSSDVENSATNIKCPTPEESNINVDIGAEIFEKCHKVCSEITEKYDFKLEKDFEELKEITTGDVNRTEAKGMSKSYCPSKKVNENTCEVRNINVHLNKSNEIVSKNRKKMDIMNKLIQKKPINQKFGMQASSPNPDLNEERLELKIIKKGRLSDSNSESTADDVKSQIINNDLEPNIEIKNAVSVEDIIEWQSSSEEGNQSTLKKEISFKKIGSNVSWDKTQDIQMECNISQSSFNIEETRLINFSEKSLSIKNGTSKTDSAKNYFDKSSSLSAESDTSENDGIIYSFENQKSKKAKDLRSNKDSLSRNEDDNFDFISKKKASITPTVQQGFFPSKKGSNQRSKCKQVNKSKNIRKEKIKEATQEGNQKISTLNTSKDPDITKQNFTNKISNKILIKSKPKTWEDLETKLLSETNIECCKISPYSYKEIENTDNLWTEKEEFEIPKITKGVFQSISKEIEPNLSVKKFENKYKHFDSRQALQIANSPNLSIINKTIQAMEKCTSRSVSPFKNSFNSSLQEGEENDDLNEYSISVHSTIIHSSRSKLSATNTFYQRTGKRDANVKKGKTLRNNMTKNNSKTPTKKMKANKDKKLTKFSKKPKTYTSQDAMQIMKELNKFAEENMSDSCQNSILEMDKNNYSNAEDICTPYNPTKFSDEINSDKSGQNFNLKETEVESCYNFRKRKIKSISENNCKKLKNELISPRNGLKNVCNKDNASNRNDLRSSTEAHTTEKVIFKNNFKSKIDSSKINFGKNLQFKEHVDSGSSSNLSFNTDEVIGLNNSLETDFKQKATKEKSVKKKQDTNLKIQSLSSNFKEKVNLESKNKNANILKSKMEMPLTAENKCTTKSDFNNMVTKGECKNKLIKKQDTKEKYKEYLKKLFRSENASNGKNLENDEDGNTNQILMMKEDDELFSISSEDSEIEENGVSSEVNLTENSGLLFDVLAEKDN